MAKLPKGGAIQNPAAIPTEMAAIAIITAFIVLPDFL
jgi:hypothetical protein